MKQKHVEVWGLAAGRGSTEGAARGAFAVENYPDEASIPREDWQRILYVVPRETEEKSR